MRISIICPLTILALSLSACQPKQEQAGPPMGPMPVRVATPISAEYQESRSFTGRLAAVESVELRAQVSGYLKSVDFEAGSRVKAGDVLFQIDSRPYEAAVQRAQADVTQAQAALHLAELSAVRARQLRAKDAVAQQEVDQREADLLNAKAMEQSAQAALSSAELNLEFTTIKAPVDGRISAENITQGNLVQAGSAAPPLALLTSTDVIYVNFDIPESALLNLPELQGDQGKLPVVKVHFDSSDKLWDAQIDYVANEVNAATGTLRLRGVIQNAQSLVPGMFCRVDVKSGKPQAVQLIAEQAILKDQGHPFIYVIRDGKVGFQPIETGAVINGMRAVTSGLPEDAQVIVAGVMRLRPDMPVNPEVVPMPSLEDPNAPAPTPTEEESAEAPSQEAE